MLALKQSVCPRPGLVICKAKKGNAKVNERGKVSSRPGPESPKQAKKRQEEAAAAQAAAAAALQQQNQPSSSLVSNDSTSPSTSYSPRANDAGAGFSAPSSTPSTTPQVVVDRIFSRMVTFASIPMVAGVGLLVIFYFFKKQGGDDVPMWPAYISQAATLLGGLLGISYGALSASWDPAIPGSALGWNEFKANLPIFLKKDGGR